MKKMSDGMRGEHAGTDFRTLVGGKYAKQVSKYTTIALIEPDFSRIFSTSKAVSDAFRGLLQLADQAAQIAPKLKRSSNANNAS
jgi:hypothetical protein